MPQGTYNIYVYVDEDSIRPNSDMIPKKLWKFVAPDVFNLERNKEVTQICPITKKLEIPFRKGSISMPIMFDLRTTRPVGKMYIDASFESKGNGLGFDWQGNRLSFNFEQSVQFLIVEKREIDFASVGQT